MKLLPHWLVSNSPLPARVGRRVVGRPFAAFTVAFWTFLPGREITHSVWRHEHRHVQQFAWGWIGGFFAIGFAGVLDDTTILQLVAVALLTSITMPVLYALAGLWARVRGRSAYRDNWFEIDARRAAGESV